MPRLQGFTRLLEREIISDFVVTAELRKCSVIYLIFQNVYMTRVSMCTSLNELSFDRNNIFSELINQLKGSRSLCRQKFEVKKIEIC